MTKDESKSQFFRLVVFDSAVLFTKQILHYIMQAKAFPSVLDANFQALRCHAVFTIILRLSSILFYFKLFTSPDSEFCAFVFPHYRYYLTTKLIFLVQVVQIIALKIPKSFEGLEFFLQVGIS